MTWWRWSWKECRRSFKKYKICLSKAHQPHREHPDLNRGPLDLQSNALPLSYTPITLERHEAVAATIAQYQLSFDTFIEDLSTFLLTVGCSSPSSGIDWVLPYAAFPLVPRRLNSTLLRSVLVSPLNPGCTYITTGAQWCCVKLGMETAPNDICLTDRTQRKDTKTKNSE